MSGLTESIIYVLQTLGQLYLLIALLRFVLQLVRADFYNPLCQFTVKVTQPLLAPLRRVIPSVAGIDLAGLVFVVLLQLLLMVILSWVAPGSQNPGAQLTRQICEPMLAPIRNLLPSLGGLDLSPIFAFISINLLERLVIDNLAVSTGLVGPIRALVSPFL